MVSGAAFKIGSWVVYPSHGVGKLESIEKFDVGQDCVEFFVISFQKNKLVLRLPVKNAEQSGLRHVISKEELRNIFGVLCKKTKKRRQMWNKRVQEYEAKINSGDPCAIAEVIRELYRSGESTVQSFSERQIYQNAIERLARELSIVEQIDEEEAIKRLEDMLLQAA
ncbi:MAG: CarD family transcriptional regulator [Holosporales bacterium]|jgi:CarD family transcriptional regulator|nr:CarD family transcriptional regulator [Holosporales bacterium]